MLSFFVFCRNFYPEAVSHFSEDALVARGELSAFRLGRSIRISMTEIGNNLTLSHFAIPDYNPHLLQPHKRRCKLLDTPSSFINQSRLDPSAKGQASITALKASDQVLRTEAALSLSHSGEAKRL